MSNTNRNETVFRTSEYRRNQGYGSKNAPNYDNGRQSRNDNREYRPQDEQARDYRPRDDQPRGDYRPRDDQPRGDYRPRDGAPRGDYRPRGGAPRGGYRGGAPRGGYRGGPRDNYRPQNQNLSADDEFERLYRLNRDLTRNIKLSIRDKKNNEHKMNNITVDNYASLAAQSPFIKSFSGFTLDNRNQVLDHNKLVSMNIQVLVLSSYLEKFVNRNTNVTFGQVFNAARENFPVFANRLVTVRFENGQEQTCLYFPLSEEITFENRALYKRFGFTRPRVEREVRGQRSEQTSSNYEQEPEDEDDEVEDSDEE